MKSTSECLKYLNFSHDQRYQSICKALNLTQMNLVTCKEKLKSHLVKLSGF